MRRLCTLTSSRIDITFAEYCFALLLHDMGLLAGFAPIVIGEEQLEPRSGKTVLDNLFHNADFKQMRDELPRIVPTATWRFVRLTLAAVGIDLPPAWEQMTVYDVMAGSTRMGSGFAAGFAGFELPTNGVLIKDCYFLEGDKGQLRLMLREFAEKVRRRIAVADARRLEAAEDELAQALQAREGRTTCGACWLDALLHWRQSGRAGERTAGAG